MRIVALLCFTCIFLFSCNTKKEEVRINKETTGDTSTVKTEKSINPYTQIDISPMDMSYYPVDYPKLKMTRTTTAPPLARIIYSRPHLQGRNLFHDVLKYGEPWRLGANEATELELYSDATILDKKIKAGRYTLYCIPEQQKWTIVLNSNIDTWGLQPDTAKDIARFIIPIHQTTNLLEYFTLLFQQTGDHAELLMAWDNMEARLPFIF
ncbi:MAG: DUF2911 domain-containing protein [Ferruginibacter sp.]|nr:DUF2911 domain-containing protein [Chitinophagaceae bacterium]